MKFLALPKQREGSFCDARPMTSSEKDSMERATRELHDQFADLLEAQPPRVSFKGRRLQKAALTA